MAVHPIAAPVALEQEPPDLSCIDLDRSSQLQMDDQSTGGDRYDLIVHGFMRWIEGALFCDPDIESFIFSRNVIRLRDQGRSIRKSSGQDSGCDKSMLTGNFAHSVITSGG